MSYGIETVSYGDSVGTASEDVLRVIVLMPEDVDGIIISVHIVLIVAVLEKEIVVKCSCKLVLTRTVSSVSKTVEVRTLVVGKQSVNDSVVVSVSVHVLVTVVDANSVWVPIKVKVDGVSVVVVRSVEVTTNVIVKV